MTKGNLSDGYDEECDPYTWIKDKDGMVGMYLSDYTDDELIALIKKIL